MDVLYTAEKILLGAILNEPKIAESVLPVLEMEDFSDPVCASVYGKLAEVSKKGLAIDVSTVASLLVNEIPSIPVFLASLISAPVSLNIDMFVSEIREKSKERKIKKLGSTMAERGLSLPHTEYQKKIEEVYATRSREGLFTFSEAMTHVIEALERQHAGQMTGVKTGLDSFDKLIRGYQRGHIHIIAARPGMGKTAFALNNFLHAVVSGHKAIFFSIEQTLVDIKKRIISNAGALPYNFLNESPLKEEVSDGVSRTMDRLKKYESNFLIDINKVSTDDIFNTALMAKSKLGGLDIIFVDYLQIMKPVKKYDSREREVAEISDGLKEIAKRLNVAVVALAQLNRDVAKRAVKRPQLCDLRDSGSIEQDADIVMFLHREGYYGDRSVDPRDCDLIISKNRHGECKDLRLKFHFDYMRFTDA